MKYTTLLLCAAFCGATALAQEPGPDAQARIRAEKDRIHKIMQAAENLQAAGMEREANQLREAARHQAEELEAKVRNAQQQAEREQGERKRRENEERERAEREGREPGKDRPNAGPDSARLQAEIAELRGTVRKLTERLERLEVLVRKLHPDIPKHERKPE